MENEEKIYKKLRRHLDQMPVGYPATRSGVEIRILRRIFTPKQAVLAMLLTHEAESADRVWKRAGKDIAGIPDEAACAALLDEMAEKGGVFCKVQGGRKHYALVPFVLGMFEFQVARLSRGFYEDVARYFRQGYALEYLSTPLPQMRVIPVEQSIGEKQHVATYDEARRLIADAGDRVGVAACICRKGKDLAGDPCKATGRRSLCIGLRDFFDIYSRQGWLVRLSGEEALEILAQSEKEGLVLQATNEQHPQAICACCGCCCGILSVLKHIPNRADFAAGNFFAKPKPDLCVGCGRCVERCHVNAVALSGGRAAVDPQGCIGCGVCVPVCKKGAMRLVQRPQQTVPPVDTAELYDTILKKKRRMARLRTGFRILWSIGGKTGREVFRRPADKGGAWKRS